MGFIYLIHAVDTKRYKIGFTDTTIAKRMRGLQTSCPFDLELVSQRSGELMLEQRLHSKLAKYRKRGEWFEFENHERALWFFHERRLRTKEEVRRDKYMKEVLRIERMAESLAAQVMSITMMVSVPVAKKNYVNPESPMHSFMR